MSGDEVREEFRKRHIDFLRGELFESRQKKFDEWAVGKNLEEQEKFLVADAMKSYVEPEALKEKPKEMKMPSRPVRAPDRSNPDD